MPPDLLEKLRIAVDGADPAALEELLAEDVHWYGSRGGACHNREDVLGMLRHSLDAGVYPRLTNLRSVTGGIVLTAGLYADSSEDDTWVVALTLDPSGRIRQMHDYENPAIAERDLALLAHPQRPQETAGAVTGLVPFVHVADVTRSIEFYQLLGMRVQRTFEPAGEPAWAMLANDQAAIMLARADEPPDPNTHPVLFYLYTHDLAGLRDQLLAAGIWPSEISDGTPGPRQEMRVVDPDGYCLMIAQIDEQPG